MTTIKACTCFAADGTSGGAEQPLPSPPRREAREKELRDARALLNQNMAEDDANEVGPMAKVTVRNACPISMAWPT